MNQRSARFSVTNSHAFSALELIAGLMLSLIVLSLSFPLFRMTVDVYHKEKVRHALDYKVATLRDTLGHGFAASNRFFAITAVKIHNGEPTFTDGTPLGLQRLNPRLRQKLGSQAISFLALEKRSFFRLASVQGTEFTLCSTTTSNNWYSYTNDSNLQNWVGLSTSGIVELSGMLRRSPAANFTGPPCEGISYRGSLRPVTHQMFGEEDEWHTMQEIIAIKESYTLYLSEDNTLRRYAHHVVENQPILNGLEALRITLATGEPSGSYALYRVDASIHDEVMPTPKDITLYFHVGSAEHHELAELFL